LGFRNHSVLHHEQREKFILPDNFFQLAKDQLTDWQIDALMKLKARIQP
jgi:hypothetical protein